ncbi:leucine rich repeat protein, BspA family protein [Entamoeba histolytica HM-1:IMSS-B]|uniref:Leucine rich repeat protein, BspA family n=6 Tax=Entamoeba histolytica TaxID=5759 RepID=C4M6R8_ENTH1|nr:uncharacterized protein EHI_088100 [Entamoeba histolytica HM-1:IMSS]EMD47532.1 leucine rich repeatcontaining protein BspA family protein [Entamoeba histolytica KU27]EMH74302.1 leucine rich repeat protein, BspA family protein [Entamoeba histolytica HM-1:IMSS-B]EMS12081.1 leucine rich repeat protein, bspa family protein [Entamoeba histolytica HM-3:IMSS]ENY60186.1 leucine rich repeat protein, bspa family protein [Entamoeba histolytica HM-1:IMSS-A]GAT97192.1 leucine rich repeat protein bspa fam|eukprot:XP_648581.1 uncharacterized protein EHI_088100 [Entamoeba histolytica HM-1:IMSS]
MTICAYGHLTVQHLVEIGNYFTSPVEFINLMIVCKKFRILTELYTYNPIDEWQIFPRITEQRFYHRLPIFLREEALRKIPGMKKYTNVYLTSYLEALKLKNKYGIDSINIIYDNVDCEHFGMKVPSHIHRLADGCFQNGMALDITRYVMPKTIWTIGQQCFLGCPHLKEVEFTNPCFFLPPHAFDTIKSLTKIMLKGIEVIEQNTFECCEGLQEIFIPTTVTKIGDFAFAGCRSLGHINIPTTVHSIGTQCFYRCSSLKEINVPLTMRIIPHMCFAYCKSLTNINFSPLVTSFQDGAFLFCSSLKNIQIPTGLTSIGVSCFMGCRSLGQSSISFKLRKSIKKVGKDSLLFNINETDIKKEGGENGRKFIDISLFHLDTDSEYIMNHAIVTEPIPISKIYPKSK